MKENKEWCEMDSAPKDRQILVWHKENEVFYCCWWSKSENEWFVGAFEFVSDASLLVWQELPKKPVVKGGVV